MQITDFGLFKDVDDETPLVLAVKVSIRIAL